MARLDYCRGVSTVRLEGVTVLADDVAQMTAFLCRGVGLRLDVQESDYSSFSGEGIRLAVFSRHGMLANTHDHPDYRRPRGGQAFELNLECENPSAVRARLDIVAAHGGTVIAEPIDTDWGHHTAFFADPEGNIHSLFAVLDVAPNDVLDLGALM